MRPDDAMEELHEAVLRAYFARLEQSMSDAPNGVLDIPSRDDVSFILAAAIPTIEAREREACAKVAARRWRDWPGIHPDDAKKGEVCDDVTACADIAAAIRSRGA